MACKTGSHHIPSFASLIRWYVNQKNKRTGVDTETVAMTLEMMEIGGHMERLQYDTSEEI